VCRRVCVAVHAAHKHEINALARLVRGERKPVLVQGDTTGGEKRSVDMDASSCVCCCDVV
jgi:hypothetical protein